MDSHRRWLNKMSGFGRDYSWPKYRGRRFEDEKLTISLPKDDYIADYTLTFNCQHSPADPSVGISSPYFEDLQIVSGVEHMETGTPDRPLSQEELEEIEEKFGEKILDGFAYHMENNED